METHDEIKRWITHCIENNACVECLYDGRDFPDCLRRMGRATLIYIRELEAKVAELDKRCEAYALNATTAIRELEETKLRCLEQIKVYADKLAEYEKPLKPMTLDEVVEKSKRVDDNVI